MISRSRVFLLMIPLLLLPGHVRADPLRLNEIQVLGSHNSYKLAMQPEKFQALQQDNPTVAASLEYSHLPLPDQLDLGIRKLELDVFYDPDSKLYGTPNPSGSSFAVMHVQSLDDRSSCPTLLACLNVLRAWSTDNPRHLPVFVSINAKDAVIDRPGFVHPLPFAEDSWLALDAELRTGLGNSLLEPSDVFQDSDLSWPLLEESRGHFLFVLDEGGEKRRSYASRWRERAMFANLPSGEEGAAIMIVNDPINDFDRIRALVLEGFIVRTRADADTREARTGSTERRESAINSGAQLISTDYYLPAAHFRTAYQVKLEPRCNPVLRPQPCTLTPR